MATKTLYFKNAAAGTSAHGSLQDGGSVTAATTATGWIVNSNAAPNYCLMVYGSELARNAAGWSTSTLYPSAAPTTTDCWRTENTLNGQFANTDWTFKMGFRSITAAYAGRVKLACRLWRSVNQNGSSAVELTGARVASAATTASLTTSADTTLTWTWSPGATKELANEYLFFQLAVEVTSAGGGTTQDLDFRVDSANGYAITTPNFVATVTGTIADTQAADTLAAAGANIKAGPIAVTQAADVLAASGANLQTVSGTIAVVQAADIFAASEPGKLKLTQAADVLAASGFIVKTGALALAPRADAFAATGANIITGAIGWTQVPDAFAAREGGKLRLTQAADLMVASSAPQATIALQQRADVLAASGANIVPLVGTAAWQSAPDTLAATGANIVPLVGTLALQPFADILAATGAFSTVGTLGLVQAPDRFRALNFVDGEADLRPAADRFRAERDLFEQPAAGVSIAPLESTAAGVSIAPLESTAANVLLPLGGAGESLTQINPARTETLGPL